MKVLIVYYSSFGNVYKMAKLVAEGVNQVEGAEAVIRKVPELMPDSLVQSRTDMKAGSEMQKDIAFVTLDDFKELVLLPLERLQDLGMSQLNRISDRPARFIVDAEDV